MNFFNTIIEFIFPSYCTICKQRGSFLCEKCLISIPHPERDLPRDIYAGFDYRNKNINQALLSLKYYGKKRLGFILGEILYERLLEEISELKTFYPDKKIILVPVPITKKRYKNRKYNQAELIAQGIMKADKNKIFILNKNIVEKTKDTLPQAKIKDRKKRLKNIKDCFSIKKNKNMSGEIIIVIDDITTTGGTLGEVMNVLKNAHAKKVIGFAVAH